jgi:hypothetical protein
MVSQEFDLSMVDVAHQQNCMDLEAQWKTRVVVKSE